MDSDKRIFKVEFFIEGNEDDAVSLRKSLAQSIADEYELCRVFGVAVTEED